MSKGQLLLLDVNLLLETSLDPLLQKIEKEAKRIELLPEKNIFSGQRSEEEFWQIVQKESAVDDYTINSWQDWWREEIKIKDTGSHLEEWRKRVNLGIVGNAFAPWIRRSLKDADFLRHIRYFWLSSETKQLFPDPDSLSAPFALGLETLCVSEDIALLNLAEIYDFKILHPGKNWIKEVNLWIE
jgi:hypothetical protein